MPARPNVTSHFPPVKNWDKNQLHSMEIDTQEPGFTPAQDLAPVSKRPNGLDPLLDAFGTSAWQSFKNSPVAQPWRNAHRLVHNLWRWSYSKPVRLPSITQIRESIAAIDASSPDTGNDEVDSQAPIFILASGWRTGSTLLQRILVTDPDVLLWGEPLGDLGLMSSITTILAQSPTFRKLHKCTISGTPSSSSLAVSWIANLCPPGQDFRSALRMIVDRWLCVPSLERGFARWGFKEVRLGAPAATVLHWLYPRAKFLLLTRHPYDCYRSLADSGWDQVYHQRPHARVDSAAEFASHWNRLVVSWSDLGPGFPCVRIRYEDLVSGRTDFRALEDWLGIKLNEQLALSAVVGRTSTRSDLTWHEKWIISRIASQGMQSFGYSK